MKIVSGILILITVFFSVRHGWGGLNMKPEAVEVMTGWGINKQMAYIISILTLAVAVLVLFPQTFFAGCVLNAMVIVLVMSFQLKTDNIKAALIEIPFLLMPLLIIWLGHPFKK